ASCTTRPPTRSSGACNLPDWPWSFFLSGCWSRMRSPMRLLLLAALLAACEPGVPSTCNNTASGDVVDGCGPAYDGGTGALPGTPDAGSVPAGSVGVNGGTADRLWFATTGDTRPYACDATDQYPKAAIAQIAAS